MDEAQCVGGFGFAFASPRPWLCVSHQTFLDKAQIHQHWQRISKTPDGAYLYEDAERNLRNHNDGLIFTPVQQPYLMSSDTLLKWKWPDLQSVDFKVYFPYFPDPTAHVRDHARMHKHRLTTH